MEKAETGASPSAGNDRPALMMAGYRGGEDMKRFEERVQEETKEAVAVIEAARAVRSFGTGEMMEKALHMAAWAYCKGLMDGARIAQMNAAVA